MSEVNHWPRCTTLRQVRDHFLGHPERRVCDKFYESSTGNRCALGMIELDRDGMYVVGAYRRVERALGQGVDVDGLLTNWNDDYDCDPDRWPVELASDEILDREWA